jgi:hypothetical protein
MFQCPQNFLKIRLFKPDLARVKAEPPIFLFLLYAGLYFRGCIRGGFLPGKDQPVFPLFSAFLI